ncbi:PLP-dependent aminotransferase family protein [Cohnella sp. AR92]|uniref:MocR-like pyridoxine biosynthesis transcription factor PdxR n=1 Tax=Cohnella sp. AR92 TaxID=648716 RepID=UPI000F8D9774|nr:PLP-dependent aminotransferase family protein [Cohnella sp. AR92]RUS42865.1 PLP-dependent aminotransferase family protein [Cohnella sp. AR92]
MSQPTMPQAANTKTKQIYMVLREKILQGVYAPGARLPSTRDLAGEFGVSRALIVEVFEQLIAEGYLEGRQGSGTYVVDLRESHRALARIHESEDLCADAPSLKESFLVPRIDFRPSFPDLSQIPRRKWKDAALAAYEKASSFEFGYAADRAGYAPLRANICRLLLHTKGISCHPSQVIVTAGATQAISLLSRLLLKPGDAVAIEDPTASFIRHIFASSGADILPVPVDEHGLRVDALPRHRNPKAVLVTPSHQFPLGSILPIGRRLQLLDYAHQTGSYVIEDDYDSEFRYAGMPVRALRELDSERVVYVGTFSKNLFPALRLGYMVVPNELLAPLLEWKRLADTQSPIFSQMTLSSFISEGHLERHVARMKRIYSKRRNVLIDGLSRRFGSQVRLSGDAAGLHLVAEFSGCRFDSDTVARMEERQIHVYPAEKYAISKGGLEDRLIMGFGNVDEARILEGIEGMAEILRK